MVVVGDGALLAALTRSRGARCATSSQPSSVTRTRRSEPGPRHHRDHRRSGHRQDGRRPAPGRLPALLRPAPLRAGGILVVGPSAAYTAYIERVLPSLGEESVTMRSLGDIVDGITAALDPPATRRSRARCACGACSRRAARDAVPGAPASSAPSWPAGRSASTRRASTGSAPRCCAATSATLPGRPSQRPGRGGLGLSDTGEGDRGGVPGPVRGPPRGRRVPARVVAAGRPP